jgi:plasmid replication initiation protein
VIILVIKKKVVPKSGECNIVVMDNNLVVQACENLNAMELKVLHYLISKIDSTGEVIKDWYSVDLQEIKTTIGKVTDSNFYRDLIDCFTKLQMPTVNVCSINKENNATSRFNTSWLTGVEYCLNKDNPNLKYCKVSFHKDLMPYLVGLSKNFTKFKFSNLVKLRKRESILLYLVLKMEEGKLRHKNDEGIYVLEEGATKLLKLTDIRDIVQLSDSYKIYGEFKRSILLPCLADILTKTDLRFEYIEIRTGRSITDIKFEFVDKLI